MNTTEAAWSWLSSVSEHDDRGVEGDETARQDLGSQAAATHQLILELLHESGVTRELARTIAWLAELHSADDGAVLAQHQPLTDELVELDPLGDQVAARLAGEDGRTSLGRDRCKNLRLDQRHITPDLLLFLGVRAGPQRVAITSQTLAGNRRDEPMALHRQTLVGCSPDLFDTSHLRPLRAVFQRTVLISLYI